MRWPPLVVASFVRISASFPLAPVAAPASAPLAVAAAIVAGIPVSIPVVAVIVPTPSLFGIVADVYSTKAMGPSVSGVTCVPRRVHVITVRRLRGIAIFIFAGVVKSFPLVLIR